MLLKFLTIFGVEMYSNVRQLADSGQSLEIHLFKPSRYLIGQLMDGRILNTVRLAE